MPVWAGLGGRFQSSIFSAMMKMACETVEGAGRDLQRAGSAVENEAQTARHPRCGLPIPGAGIRMALRQQLSGASGRVRWRPGSNPEYDGSACTALAGGKKACSVARTRSVRYPRSFNLRLRSWLPTHSGHASCP